MTEKEIKQGFLAIDPKHTFFLALIGMLEVQIASEMAAVCRPDLPDAARHFNAGRLAGAMDTLSEVTGTMEQARAEEQARIQRETMLGERRRAQQEASEMGADGTG